MVDIAQLGFSVATGELAKGKAALDALVPAAARVTAATVAMARADLDRAKASLAATRATDGATKADIAAAQMSVKKASAMLAATQAQYSHNNAVNMAAAGNSKQATTAEAAAGATRAQGAAAEAAAGKIARLGAAANDNINRMQATPSNIAAQFQDIGVTAAAGMNPMLIALQQGTQLSAAFAGGFGGIGAALKQIFSPVALLTIGMVGLVAAGLQMIDWAEVGQAVLYGLADALEVVAPYALAAGAALALVYAPTIITAAAGAIAFLAKGFWGLAASIYATVGLPVLVIAGIVAIVAAANIFRDDLTKILGFDIVKVAKDGVNFIVGFFVGAFNGIKATWSMLPAAMGDLAYQAANATLQGINWLINNTIALLNGLIAMLPFGLDQALKIEYKSEMSIANPFAGSAGKVGGMMADEMSKAQGVDYVGAAIKEVNNLTSWASGKLRGLADGFGGDDKKDKKGKTDRAAKGRTKKDEPTNEEKFADLMKGADRQLADLKAENAMIGLYGQELAKARYERDLLNQAIDKGIKLGPIELQQISAKADALAKQSEANRKGQWWQDLIEKSEETNLALERERGELGLTGEALIAYRYETDILAQAKRDHIDITKEEADAIHQSAIIYGRTTFAIEQMREKMEFTKGTIKGFFMDFYQNIREGGNIFDAFADAFVRMIDKIIDRILDAQLDKLIDGLLNAFVNAVGASGGSGFSSSDIGKLQSVASSGGGSGGSSSAINSAASGAKSGFAKGGAFTNGIFSTPTMFKFANGGALGEMGEAGPEAVMPLHRGSDGSLGVRMNGGNRDQGGGVTVAITNYHTLSGAISSQDVIELNRKSAEQTKADLRRQIPGIVQQYQRDGALT